MKKILALFLVNCLLSVAAYGEDVGELKVLKPIAIHRLPEIPIKEVKKIGLGDYEEMTASEKKIYEKIDSSFGEFLEHFYSTDCSWYCGGQIDTVYATSYKGKMGNVTYKGMNTHDFDPETAWVEGVKGNGVGEKLTYVFPGGCPRITKILIMNGYSKTEKAWLDNGRVKRLKVYYDKKPFAILELNDQRSIQEFEVGVLGYKDAKHPQWTLTFEIMDVYPGDRYEDTAITELYFDGIDVH